MIARMARRRANLLRPPGFDELGLRHALSDRMLPFMVAAMTFLAALAVVGAVGATSLGRHWRQGAGASLTVQVPLDPGASAASSPRLAAVLDLLRKTQAIAEARPLSDDELMRLLQPWLGNGVERLSLPLPAVIAVRLNGEGADLAGLSERLAAAAPGTLVESHGVWIRRLSLLSRSLQACAGAALLIVAAVAASVTAVATRAGLAARREAIEIVHGLGATDGYIARRFARRIAVLTAAGGMIGALAALPVLLGLADLAAPFAGLAAGDGTEGPLAALPSAPFLALPALPLAAGLIGFVTAHGTVRRWLRQLP